MNTVTVVLGCLLAVVAVATVVQSKAIGELDNAPHLVNENAGVDLLADKLVEGFHQLVTRDAENNEAAGKTMDFTKLIAQAKRFAEVIQIIKERDVGAGIELIKKIIMEFLGHGNQ